MKSSKNYLPKIMLIVVLIISCILIMVACDEDNHTCDYNCEYCKWLKSNGYDDSKIPFKYEKPFGIELTVATLSCRNVGKNNYSELLGSNLLTEDGKAKLKEVQKETYSNAYGIYLGYDKDGNAVLYIGGVYRGALYEKYDCALPYSPRDIITKMEEAVGHTLSADWLNARETGIDILFIPKEEQRDSNGDVIMDNYEVAYIARVDGQVYVITM